MLLGGAFSVSIPPMDRVKGGKKGTISTSEKDINPVAVTRKTVETVSPPPQGAQFFLFWLMAQRHLALRLTEAAPAEGDGCVMGQFLIG